MSEGSQKSVSGNPPGQGEPPLLPSDADIYKLVMNREDDRRTLFKCTVTIALGISIVLYGAFLFWVFCPSSTNDGKNWHLGLMLVLPASSILLTLIPVLAYRRKSEKEDLSLPQIKQLGDALKPFFDIFNRSGKSE